MALPTLTPEQRADALAKAAEARKKRAEVKAELKSGTRSLADVLKNADGDATLGKMKVSTVLESLPGVGKVRAQKIDGGARHLRHATRARTRHEAARAPARALRQEVVHRRLVRRGRLIVVAGPSGVGKGSLVTALMSRDPDGLARSISATTRAPRPTEVNQVDYRFVSDAELRRDDPRRRLPGVGRGLRRQPIWHASRRGGAPPRCRARRRARDRRAGCRPGRRRRFPRRS